MPELILFSFIALLFGGMFRCESERDLPVYGKAFYKKDYPNLAAILADTERIFSDQSNICGRTGNRLTVNVQFNLPTTERQNNERTRKRI